MSNKSGDTWFSSDSGAVTVKSSKISYCCRFHYLHLLTSQPPFLNPPILPCCLLDQETIPKVLLVCRLRQWSPRLVFWRANVTVDFFSLPSLFKISWQLLSLYLWNMRLQEKRVMGWVERLIVERDHIIEKSSACGLCVWVLARIWMYLYVCSFSLTASQTFFAEDFPTRFYALGPTVKPILEGCLVRVCVS